MNRIIKIGVALLLCVVFQPILTFAARNSGTTYARDAFRKYVDSGEISGVITVFHKNGIEETTCLGYANVEKKRPIAMDQVFQQCSQTKGFCGVSAAILIEEGRLGLEDPVSKYLPEFRELWIEVPSSNDVRTLVRAKNRLTMRMLLTHTGGLPFELPRIRLTGGWSRRMPLRSVANMAATLPLKFEPGTKVQYSNIGMDTAAAVIEVVTGMRWEDFLKRRILDPLGMTDTTFWPADEQLRNKIDIYTVRTGEKAKHIDQIADMQRPWNDDRVFPSAGAGLWTSARDQLKFYKMLMNLGMGENGVRILREDTVKSLLAVSQRPKGIDPEGYSLGLAAPWEDDEDAFFGHGGALASQCLVNWHRKELRLLAVQFDHGSGFRGVCAKAAERFFSHAVNDRGVNAYTGRTK